MQAEPKTATDAVHVTVQNIPAEVWRQLKIKAATDGDTVKVAVTKALQQYVSAA